MTRNAMTSARISRVRIALRLAAAVLLLALVTFAALALNANATTVGFAYLITILGISVFSGLTVSLVSSIVATACFNYFFLPPVRTWTIADPANWVALFSFFIASLVATRLVVQALERRSLGADETARPVVSVAPHGRDLPVLDLDAHTAANLADRAGCQVLGHPADQASRPTPASIGVVKSAAISRLSFLCLIASPFL